VQAIRRPEAGLVMVRARMPAEVIVREAVADRVVGVETFAPAIGAAA
jgi:alpha-D-ribose 1-methylphosphonate 5-triphosphate synthase subunit PhnG